MVIWYILLSLGIFCGNLVYFVVIWYIFPVWVFCTKKNVATLVQAHLIRSGKARAYTIRASSRSEAADQSATFLHNKLNVFRKEGHLTARDEKKRESTLQARFL
jgi:hypothetical protein